LLIFITGGAGFIGSAVIRQYLNETDFEVVNIDALTYAGNLESLPNINHHSRYFFEHADITDRQEMKRIFEQYQPDVVMHLAAESHVDRSIDKPTEFIMTNVVGTCVLLESARDYWDSITGNKKSNFRFHHISTDEVYGELDDKGLFTEESAYQPNSPYSASKASSDHFVRAWSRTYGLPIVISNCSNNYGPYQFPEKLIPLIILNALEGKSLPIYGDGQHVRDWLYVDDHARALRLVVAKGAIGETYNIGGNNEQTNLEVVRLVCSLLDERLPDSPYCPHHQLINYVEDRPGHDKRYAIDASKIERELDWEAKENFESGLKKTLDWYLDNKIWCDRVKDGSYQGERLGLIK